MKEQRRRRWRIRLGLFPRGRGMRSSSSSPRPVARRRARQRRRASSSNAAATPSTSKKLNDEGARMTVCSKTDDDLSAEVRGDFPSWTLKTMLACASCTWTPRRRLRNRKKCSKRTQIFTAKATRMCTEECTTYPLPATELYEQSRAKVAAFIHAKTDREIVFTRNASEALNLIANTWGEERGRRR